MNKLTNEDFLAWAEKNSWLIIGEGGNATGRAVTYMTPAGEVVVAQYNLQGELQAFIKPQAMPMPMMMRGPGPGLDLRGGAQHP